MNATSKFDDKKLPALGRALRAFKNARVRVGILSGAKVGRYDIEKTTQDKFNNPTLGIVHEFGSKLRNIPARSFLRMPLTLFLPKRIQQIGIAVWRALVIQNGPLLALKQLGVAGENVVQEAFETGGFGRWAKWSPRYASWRMRFERARSKLIGPLQPGSLLILSGQLRRSVTSRVYQDSRTTA